LQERFFVTADSAVVCLYEAHLPDRECELHFKDISPNKERLYPPDQALPHKNGSPRE
jgi:hypothetical protein